jgi:hypothetical protein
MLPYEWRAGGFTARFYFSLLGGLRQLRLFGLHGLSASHDVACIFWKYAILATIP